MINIKNKIKTFFTTPNILLKKFTHSKMFNLMPDKLALKILFKASMGTKLNLDNPISFSEKLQWLKIYNRDPKLTTLVDKYKVKDYVKSVLGEEYIIPTIGVYNKFDDIDFNKLPNQFVLKCNHGSGDVVICKDKSKFDINIAREKLTKSLKTNYYKIGREWPYKNVERKIICEKYLDEINGSVSDYKFFCFNGEPKIMFIVTDRNTDCRLDFFDMDFNHLDILYTYPNADKPILKPENFYKMKEIARKLSKGLDFARVDLYSVNNKIYFGEITLYPGGGDSPFNPPEWDYKLGEWLELPVKNKVKGK